MSTFFNETESRPRSERLTDQNERLAEMVRLGYENAPRVKGIFDALGVSPDDIRAVEDLEKLPVISREALVEMESEEPPYGGLTHPDMETDRIFISPGPVYEPHLTEDDPLWAAGYFAAGFGRDDIVLNAFSYHMVAAGITFHEGLRSVGATVIPSGTAGTEAQVQLLRDLRATAFTGTPSFLMAIIARSEEMGYDFTADFALRKASFVAEPLPPSLRRTFEEQYGIDTYQMYGATEVGDIAYECVEKDGWHISDSVIVEVVDPSTGSKVEPGQLGEVVVTRLNTIFFLFRFGTGDLSRMVQAPCPCGRTSYRLDGIAGRVGDAVKVRGLFVAPSQLKLIKEQCGDMEFQLVVTRESFRDFLTVRIESVTEDPSAATRFGSLFQDICTVKIDRVEFVKPGEIKEKNVLIRDTRQWK